MYISVSVDIQRLMDQSTTEVETCSSRDLVKSLSRVLASSQPIANVKVPRTLPRVGSLKVILSMMYGGKSSYLIHIIETLGYACKVLYVNHSLDTRGKGKPYSTHSISLSESLSSRLNATMIQVEKLASLPVDLLATHSVVCIDEGQFFSDLCDRVNYMVNELHLDVYVAGLNGDSRRQKFGSILDLIPNADEVMILRDTLCSVCASNGDRVPALFTWRIKDSPEQIETGAKNYIPVCRGCYNYLEKERIESK